jgi:hypothetical protein
MHFFSFDAAWQLSNDRRRGLLEAFEESRLRRRRRQQRRSRPSVDDLPRSSGGPPPVLRAVKGPVERPSTPVSHPPAA